MPIVLSPNMSLPVPVVGQEPGPQYATDINSCMSVLDSHTHSLGSGVQITPDGININNDLPINSNNLTSVRTVNFIAQGTSLPGVAPDLGCIYVVGVDLYYNDESGNVIQITTNGGVAGSNGSISNLTPPASASYVSGTDSFVWQSNANTAANMDNGSVTIREVAANTNGVTIESPTALASDYTITLLPALPGANSFITINSSGQLSTSIPTNQGIDTGNIANNAITTAKIADTQVTNIKLAAVNYSSTGDLTGTFATSFVSMGTVSLTTVGRPVIVLLTPTIGSGRIQATNTAVDIILLRDAVQIQELTLGSNQLTGVNLDIPPGAVSFFDVGAGVGVHSYELRIRSTGSSGDYAARLVAYEL